jgi:hypothetical protein
MSKRKLSILLGSLMLMAALLFTFSPLRSGTAEAANATVNFANANWACTTAACTSKVGQGAAQPNYQCAEFAARSLAASGYIPGLSTKSSQSAYENYKPGNGKTYDLLAITPSVATPRGTLANFLTTYGYFKNMGESMSDAEPGDLVAMGNNAHVVVIVSTNRTVASTLIDAHNDARYHVSLSNELSGFSGSWYLLHIQTGA